MTRSQERVTFVRFGFSADNLYSVIKPNRHKETESIDKYARLCEKAIRDKYPNADVEVIWDGMAEGVLPSSIETLVYVADGFEDREDDTEAAIVDELCQRVYHQFDWLVSESSILVAESQDYCQLPATVVRWACVSNLIDGANRHRGLWNVPINALLRFRREDVQVADDGMVVVGKGQQLRTVFWEDMKEHNLRIGDIPEHIEFLISSLRGFDLQNFEPQFSYLRVLRDGSEMNLAVHHFIDVEGWSSPQWAYEAYAKALVTQAKRLGVECDYEVVESSELQDICGVIFTFRGNVPSDGLLFDFVDAQLRTLLEIIDSAELSLVGGPVWDAIYEKNEDRFCREVLDPLLHRMGFQSIRYTHSNRREHGRDFIFAYHTPFHEPIYFGLQAKKGRIGGSSISKIREILDQIETAFTVPFRYEPTKSKSDIYIACMIIAISGEFTDDALDKIQAGLPQHRFPIGSVYFWDKPRIMNLISLHFPRRST